MAVAKVIFMAKKRRRKGPATAVKASLRSSEQSVNHKMFYEFHSEFKSETRALALRMDSQTALHQSHTLRFDSVDKRFDSLEKRIESFEAKVMAKLHEIQLIVEEQNHRNKIVLDALAVWIEQHKQLDERVKILEGN